MLKEEMKMRDDRHSEGPAIRGSGVVAVSLIALLVALTVLVLGALGGRPAAAAPAVPDETTDVATFYATADSYVSQSAPSDNYGTESYFWIQRDADGNEQHALIAFDTSSLPSDIVVVSATLRLYSEINLLRPETPADILPVQPEAVVSSWTETGVTWNSRPPSSDLGDPTVDYQVGWQYFDVTNIAQAWVDGSVTNYGIKLTPEVGVEGWAFYWARNYGTAGPRLTIEYEAAPPPCTAVSGVAIDGPTAGQTGSDYTFSASISPVDATEPFTYTWSATGHATSSDPTATYNWSTIGEKTVRVTVENCGGSAVDTQTVTIEDPLPTCETPLADLGVNGPTSGATDRTYTFAAAVRPTDADTPITFTWEATGQSQEVQSGSETTSDVAWSWETVGSKQITVTAENCGASFVRHRTIDVVTPSTLPDLVPGEPWYDALQGSVGYIVHNEGLNAAPAGHSVGYYFGTVNQASVIITDTIPGGGVRAGLFDEPWSCAVNSINMRLEVDEHDVVEEGDEGNNEHAAFWPCDLTPPTIVDGPTVTDRSAVTAEIEWTTDEATTGRLEYGLTSYGPSSVDSGGEGTVHSVSLTGLEPATTYRMRAFAEDDQGNLTNTGWVFFETNTPGVDPPVVVDFEINYLENHDYDTYVLLAELDTVEYVDRVEFYLDGAHVGTDYETNTDSYGVYFSPPAMGYTPDSFFEQEHTLEARAYSTNGLSSTESVSWEPDARPAPIFLQFWDPASGQKFEVDGDQAPSGTTIDAHVFAVETNWKCSWGGSTPNTVGLPEVDCADANPRPVQHLQLRLNGVFKESVDPAPELSHIFSVDVGLYSLGEHTLRVTATGSDNELTSLERTFELVRGEPDFRYERTVTRQDNVFEIAFSVTNEGTAAARLEAIRDKLYGFQLIHDDWLPGRAAPAKPADVEVYYTVRSMNTWWESTVLKIDLSSPGNDYVRLAPGETVTVAYTAVPVLYPYPWQNDRYRIGAEAGDIFHFLSYREDYDNAGLWTDEFYATGAVVDDAELGGLYTLNASVTAAVAEADYLIITSPYNLKTEARNTTWAGVDPDEERERLYSDMAELASVADGVIGYYADSNGLALNELLEPGGYWYEALHPNFRQTLQGYVLIVGEREVIPAMGAGYDVPWSDLRYASTGGDARPELVLGRLVGDDVATLRKPLDAAIRYHQGVPVFDHSDALLYAGRTEGEGSFWDAVKEIDYRLPDSTNVTRIRSKDLPTNQAVSAFVDNAPGSDIIVYRGHGYTSGEGFAINEGIGVYTNDMLGLGNFGGVRPFIFALACSAGDYEEDDDFGIAEASLRTGAAVFIGSTNLSHRTRNNEAARWFFNRFQADRSVGDTFADLLRDKFHEYSMFDESSDFVDWGRWAYQYQLYGDPKFGRLTAAAGHVPETVLTELPGDEVLNVTLGEMDVYEDEGWHWVNIPDGGHVADEGAYAVPTQQVIAHYPAGTRVQDVQLTVRGGLVVTTGLNIPLSYFRQDGNGVWQQHFAGPMSAADGPNEGWTPNLDQPYQWRVAENADGSSDLLLVIYPFSYNPATTDARYYREWTFDVETTTTTVTAGRLQTGALRYGLGETVTATLALHNDGSAQDVVISPVIRDLRGMEIAGLPLRTLHGVQGDATTTLEWESDGIPAGDYVLEVALLDQEGNELDKQRADLTLGIVEVEGVSLEADPYASGGIPLTLTLRNSGDTSISGTVHLRVENVETGEIVATFEQNEPVFEPGSEVALSVVWDDEAAPAGQYQAVGYLEHGGTISTPLIRYLGDRLFLPAVTGR